MEKQPVYTYNDIALVPQYSTIKSRLDTSLETKLTRNLTVDMPLIPSNMDTVISTALGKIILENGGIPIYHRYCSIEDQIEFAFQMKGRCFLSCGVSIDDINMVSNIPCLGVCFDIAHGHCEKMVDAIKYIKLESPEKEVIAGNICTIEGYEDLVNAGADAIKVGVGSGSICTTRMVTGHGVSMFSSIYDINKYRLTLPVNKQVPIIADGGITHNRDVVLALAAGANSVMIGNLFAKSYQSAGEKVVKDGITYKKYRGQASREFQEEFYGSVKEGTTPEGVSSFIECKYSSHEFINNFCGGIRSGLTYSGAHNINELQKKAKFVFSHSSTSFMNESMYRVNIEN